MLSDSRISELIRSGDIGFERPGATWIDVLRNVQPASIEVTLADAVLLPGWKPGTWTETVVTPIHPGEFMLASTVETLRLPDFLVARIEGKSTLARKGLAIHSTAGFVDPGFHGTLTLELSNVGAWPIVLEAGMPIAQLSFDYVDGKVDRLYGSKGLGSHYQDQSGPTAARG